MSNMLCTLVVAGVLMLSASAATGQEAFGHWTGSINLPTGEIALEVDIAKTADGGVIATLNQPSSNVKGLPLANVKVKGSVVSFDLPGASGASFSGMVSADGSALVGSMSNLQGSLPMTFERKGDAVVALPPVSPAITKALEGTWAGTLDVMGRQLHVVMTLTNRPDKTAVGSLVSLDEGGLTMPVAIEQSGADVTVKAAAVGSTFKGTLDAAGTALTGTYSQGGMSFPLAFHRDPAK